MKKINIGIIGLGTIGTGVYKILKQRRGEIKKRYNIEVNINKCCDISTTIKKKLKIPSNVFTKDFYEITNSSDIDLVIELIGGTKVAYEISKETLKNKKHLVTANKALLAYHGKELKKLRN